MKYTLKELAQKTDSKLIGNDQIIVTQIIFDSRLIFSSKDNAFIVLNDAGLPFIPDAIKRGIRVIISPRQTIENSDLNWLITEDPLDFLRKLARTHLQSLKLETIGITGSNGKTIVKEWLYQCLWNELNVVKSPKSYNSQIGLPLSMLEANDQDQLGIFEVGISKPGEMKRQAKIFSPKIGIFTYLGSAHSEYFDTLEQKLNEKLELFNSSEVIIYNGDSELVNNAIKKRFSEKKLISYGLKESNKVRIKRKTRSQEYEIVFSDGSIRNAHLQNGDEASLHNTLAIVTTLESLGFDKDKIIRKISELRSVEMRMESIKGARNNLIINDSYNLDLDSLKIALSVVPQYHKEGKALVLTDIIDERKSPESLYPTVAKLVNEQVFDHVFLMGDQITSFSDLFQNKVSCFKNVEHLLQNENFNRIANSLILLKGARRFKLEEITKSLELQTHDTVLEINLNAILHNIKVHKSFLKPETKMMAMVKAFSYGLGGYEIAEFLQHHNIDYLGVAYTDEGVALRHHNITIPIMVMNSEMNSYDTLIEYNLEPEIWSFKVLNLLIDSLRKKGVQKEYPIHVMLETGMHRQGFRREHLDRLLQTVKENNIRIVSIFTHLAAADDPQERQFTLEQIKTYEENSDYLLKRLSYHPIRHCLNSAGITQFADHQFDMVRIGIGMIGYSAYPEIRKLLQNAVRFKTIVTQVAPLYPGETVGYNRHFKAVEKTQIATIAVGYADGVRRSLGNGNGFVGIHNKMYPIVGNVCMDMLMVDIGDDQVSEGDEVIIFDKRPNLEEIAEKCGTIPYEILTSISRRVKRIYIKD